jgi:hypothetical protein
MVINLRSAAGMATIWVVAVAGVSATAWVAIDRAGRDITSASVNTLAAVPLSPPPPVEPTGTGPAPATTSTPAPSVSPPPSAAPSTSATTGPRGSRRHPEAPRTFAPQTAQVRSVTVPGGQVTVRCIGPRIRLQVAQPENGWRVHVDTGSGRIAVTFSTGDDEEGTRRTNVSAVCDRGIPDFAISH